MSVSKHFGKKYGRELWHDLLIHNQSGKLLKDDSDNWPLFDCESESGGDVAGGSRTVWSFWRHNHSVVSKTNCVNRPQSDDIDYDDNVNGASMKQLSFRTNTNDAVLKHLMYI